MASGRQVEYNLRLNSNAVSVLNQANQSANKFENSMWQVQKTLASFGLGLGAHFIIDAAKNWTQGAADYEQAMLRIKNASKEGLGILNQEYANEQVDKFKLNLQKTSDAYGNFLFKIKNAGLSNDVQNRLFENLNIVGKVAAIPQEQMDATVRNLGIMLGEGVLEARHLRQLSYVHPQIVPYLAEALGLKNNQKDAFDAILHGEGDDESAQQKLSLLISSGKLTKLAINSSVLINAFEKYRESLETKLPETLKTVQSELNDLSNSWERFKLGIVLENKDELIRFFHSLERSIKWLSEHSEEILSIGKSILHLVEAYTVWKAFLFTLEAPLAIIGFFKGEFLALNKILQTYSSILGTATATESAFTSASAAAAAANYAEAESVYAKTVAYEAFQDAFWVSQQRLLTSGALALPEGQRMIGAGSGAWTVVNPGSSYGTIAPDVTEAEIAASTSESASILSGLTFAQGALVVGLSAVAIYELAKVLQDYNKTDRQETFDFNQRMAEIMLREKVEKRYDETPAKYYFKTLEEIDKILNYTGITDIAGNKQFTFLDLLGNWSDQNKLGFKDPFHHPDNTGANNKGVIPKIPEAHHLRGNSSNYYTVHIQGGINGMVNPVFKQVDGATMTDVKQEVGIQISALLTDVIDDVQLTHTH